MSEKNMPKSHGRFGNEEMGMEFSPPENKVTIESKQNNIGSKFKKMKKKMSEVARQNLE